MENNAIFDKMDSKINALVNDNSISHEIRGQVLAEYFRDTGVQLNAQALDSALKVVQVSAENFVQEKNADLIVRKIQGYDDNMLIKNTEFQSGVTGFAVNSGSNTAQDAINDLKAKMEEVSNRVLPLDGNPVCPTPVPITPAPSGFVASDVQDLQITVEWSSVSDATSYQVYQDGVQVATGNSLSYTATGLTQLTKYAFTVKASRGGLLSDFTPALVVQTIATP